MPDEKTLSLPECIPALALLATQATGASGYALHVHSAGRPTAAWICGEGQIPSSLPREAVVAYRLRDGLTVIGTLEFAFLGVPVPAETSALLGRVAGLIESLWCFAGASERHARLAARASELETRLADLKIADRARGLLASGTATPGTIETIARHVATVLRPSETGTMLSHLVTQLEDTLDVRELTAQAKTVLQTRHRMSEEQAHRHLRHASRTARRRLRDVAIELIER